MEIPGFCGGMYKGRSFAIDGQECMNLYAENNGPFAKGQYTLVGTPGKVEFAEILEQNDGGLSVGENRGFLVTATDRFFAVCGGGLYEIGDDGSYQLRGSLATYTKKVSIIENQGLSANQLVLTDGFQGYCYDLDTDTFSIITHADYPVGTHLVSIDGYILQNRTNTQEIYFTTDALTWDASQLFSAESSPDNISCLSKVNNELWAMGSKSIDIFYDSGANADQPFEKIKNAFVEIGVEAPNSVATLGNTIFWLGANSQGHGTVWMASGYQAKDVSTHAIEYILNQLSKNYGVSDAVAYAYQDEGHSFYVLSFPAGNRTLVYDMTTDLWHERGYWNAKTGMNDRDRGQYHAFYKGKNYLGDYGNSKIYEMDLDYFDDDGNPIRRVRSCAHLHSDRKRVFFKNLEIDLERGVGLSTWTRTRTEQLAAWYKFEDNVVDSENALNGTPGAFASLNYGTGKTGKDVEDYSMDQTGFTVANSSKFNFSATDKFKVGVWIYKNATMDVLAGNIICKMKDDGTDIDWGLKTYPAVSTGCNIQLFLGNSWFVSDRLLVENGWNYVLFEYDNQQSRLSINNILDTTVNDTPITNHAYKLHVISNPNVSSCTPSTIQIDELKIHNGDDILSDDPAGADPKVMLEISNDGGASFGNEIWMSAGRVGKRLTRVIARRLGQSRDRVYRISLSDPVKWIITGARQDVEVEND